MSQGTLLALMAATVLGVLPSCGDDDEDDGTGMSTGGRSASGGAATAGDAGAGARTGGTGGGAGARGGSAGQVSTGGAAGDAAVTGGAGGETASGGASGAGASTTGGTMGTSGGAATAGEAGAGGGGSGGDAGAGAGGESQGGSAGEPGALDDPEILHVVSTANQGEIEQATIALDRAADDSVRAFAEMMLEEHGASLAAGSELSQELGLANNPVSMALMTESNAVVVQLKAAAPDAFDALYIESQVTAHETVLTLLEEELIPAADDATLETYLETTRSAVASHLQTAQAVAEDLD